MSHNTGGQLYRRGMTILPSKVFPHQYRGLTAAFRGLPALPAPPFQLVLALQLPPTDQPAFGQVTGGDRFAYRTIGLGRVSAVGEPAARGVRLDIGERPVQPGAGVEQ